MYVSPEMVVVPVVFFIPASVVFARMWFKHKEKMAELQGPRDARNPELESRLARIEQAVDAMAIEMERVGEGQRFLTKVLSDPNATPRVGPGSSAPER